MESEETTKDFTNHSEGDMNVCTACHGNLSDNCKDIDRDIHQALSNVSMIIVSSLDDCDLSFIFEFLMYYIYYVLKCLFFFLFLC